MAEHPPTSEQRRDLYRRAKEVRERSRATVAYCTERRLEWENRRPALRGEPAHGAAREQPEHRPDPD
jgi:hypothetical protein